MMRRLRARRMLLTGRLTCVQLPPCVYSRPMAVGQSIFLLLIHRIREQARSHIFDPVRRTKPVSSKAAALCFCL